jgi:hypothetical protein
MNFTPDQERLRLCHFIRSVLCSTLCSLAARLGSGGHAGLEAKLAEYQRRALRGEFSEEVDSESSSVTKQSVLKTLKNLKTGSLATGRRDSELKAFQDRVSEQLAEHKR